MFGIPIHFFFTHFPIALTVLAAIYDLRAHFGKRPELHRMGFALSLWAAAGAAMAMLTGLQLLGDRSQVSRATLHAALGLISGLVLIALAMIRYSAEARKGESSESGVELWFVLELLAVVAVVVTAVTGHRLVLEVLGK
jgi:uncharacterized membrane protein